MNLKPALLVIISQLLFVPFLESQTVYFRHYQVENGLSNNTVGCSLADRKGFLWFGTKDGLNRFNGYSFKTYRNDRDDPASIGSNFIISLHEAKDGALWIGTDRGIYRFDATTESFSALQGAVQDEIPDLQTDDNNGLWFIARMKLFRYDLKAGRLKKYNRLPYNVTTVCKTADGILWIATSTGFVGRYQPASDSFEFFDLFGHSSSKWIEELYDGGNGKLFAGTSKHGMKIFDTQTHTYEDITLSNDTEVYVRDFMQNGPDEYWIATESGLFIYNSVTKKTVSLKKDYTNPYSLSDNAVYTLCRDKEGGMWVGTYFGGINYHPKPFIHFETWFPKTGINSISGNAIREICQDNFGHLWIGTEDAGLNELNLSNGQFTHNPISHTNVHGLLITNDQLWVGTFHHGLNKINVRTGRLIERYTAASHALPSDFVSCIIKTQAGAIVIGTNHGICYYNAATNNFDIIKELPMAFYTRIYEDREGTIWAGTRNQGLYYYNPRTKQKGQFQYMAANKSSISGNRINWIMEDSKGGLWITTEGGISQLHPLSGAFTNYTTKDGLPSNIIYAMLEDDKGVFWISTSKGLGAFSPATKKITTYTRTNGLLSDQFNYNSAFKDPKGRMYFGSVKGLISFHPSEIITNTFVPPVYITGFQVLDKEVEIGKKGSPLTKSITATDDISLRYNQSTFSIDFAALSFTAPELTEYAYRMEGLNSEWTYLKSNRKVFFTQLPPGSYSFQVKASVASGSWNSRPTLLHIEILPPFWESKWAYLLYALAAAGIILLIIRFYHQRNEEKNQQKLNLLAFEHEKEMYKAKIDFFTHVAHEIRTPLFLIKGPLSKVMRQADELPSIKRSLEIMQKNTDRLIDLTTQLLDFRKTEVNAIHLTFVETDITALLKNSYAEFKPSAEQKNIRFELETPPVLLVRVDEEALKKIISNLLNNAIKYAQSLVLVSLNAHADQTFSIIVKNDGYLIPYDMKEKIFETFFRLKATEMEVGTGIGLALSRSLAELHKGTLQLAPPENDMNVFELHLPVTQ
jgi:ligand-binding sensor domain-containing protein/signal transduction histidine kinase